MPPVLRARIPSTEMGAVGKNLIRTAQRHVLTMPTENTTLPNEIQDRILDFLHDCKPTLLTCALVCRTWVPTSRYHLFSEVILYAFDFTSVFDSPNCTIRSCKHLEIWGTCLGTETTVGMIEILHHLIPRLSPSSLLLGDWPVIDGQTRATFAQFPSIECLWLKVMDFNDFHYLDTILMNYPNVCELHMDDCFIFGSVPYICNYLFAPRLRSLELSRCKMNPLLRYFLRGGIVPDFFSIENLAHHDLPIIGEYFSMYGDAVQELRIGFRDVQGTCYSYIFI